MKALYVRFHLWRGIGGVDQGDLFACAYRFGFATLYVCKQCLVERLQQFKQIVDEIEIASRDNPERQARHWDGR